MATVIGLTSLLL